MNLTLKDFQLCNDWREEVDGEKFLDQTPMYIIDQSTGRKYLNASDASIRLKLAMFSYAGTPVAHSILLAGHAVYRIAKLITASHFWIYKENESKYSFTYRLEDAAVDLLKVAMAPLVLIGLELSAVYGIFNPLDGRKLFASLERFEFENNFILAPCFQPSPTHHLFGGDLNRRDTF